MQLVAQAVVDHQFEIERRAVQAVFEPDSSQSPAMKAPQPLALALFRKGPLGQLGAQAIGLPRAPLTHHLCHRFLELVTVITAYGATPARTGTAAAQRTICALAPPV